MTSDDEDDSSAVNDSGSEPNISVILLAAGSSSRLGRSKQLLPVEGIPLLVHSANAALAAGIADVIIVLGANEQPHEEVLQNLPVKLISNHYWKSGMGSSIKTGLHYLIKNSPESEAAIIMVCDQPGISPQHLQLLIKKHRESRKAIIASLYSGTAGVPALFARSFFSNILMLKDEHGAKKIIEQFSEQVEAVLFPEGTFDIDTKEDYENYLKRK